MRRDAEKYRRSLKLVEQYRKPEVYKVQPEDYECDSRYIDTEYIYYMANNPECNILTLHYDTVESAWARCPAMSETICRCKFPFRVANRGNCIYVIRDRVTQGGTNDEP